MYIGIRVMEAIAQNSMCTAFLDVSYLIWAGDQLYCGHHDEEELPPGLKLRMFPTNGAEIFSRRAACTVLVSIAPTLLHFPASEERLLFLS